MAEQVAKTWVPSSKTAIAAAVRKLLSEGNPERATILLLREGFSAHFRTLACTISLLTGIREDGIKILLSEQLQNSPAFEYVYAEAGVPEKFYPLFAVAVDLARQVRTAQGKPLTKDVQLFLLDKALEYPAVTNLSLSPEFVHDLVEYIRGPKDPTLNAEEPVVAVDSAVENTLETSAGAGSESGVP